MGIRYETNLRYPALMSAVNYLAENDEDLNTSINSITTKSQNIWNSGNTVLTDNLTMADMFNWPKRKPENEEAEKNKLLQDTADQIFAETIKSWTKRISREDFCKMVNTVTWLDRNVKATLFEEFSIRILDLVKAWNSTHAEDEQIFVQPEFEI